MQDIHSHIIYGVDDGASSFQESIAMLNAAKQIGIDRIYATPHIKSEDIDIGTIYERFAKLHEKAKTIGIDLRLGFEYNFKAIDYDDFATAKDYALGGTDILLLEMPFMQWPSYWQQTIYDLQSIGLQIIIAHPERYLPIQKDLGIIHSLADMGCNFQCNASSIINYNFERNKVVRCLMKMNRLDMIASDAHSVNEYALLDKAYDRMKKVIRFTNLERIVFETGEY